MLNAGQKRNKLHRVFNKFVHTNHISFSAIRCPLGLYLGSLENLVNAEHRLIIILEK
jgi:hypothetical protein